MPQSAIEVTPVFINYARGLFVGTASLNLIAPILINEQVGALKVCPCQPGTHLRMCCCGF